ncbi:MAG: dUTP diphosphatase [Candidatus Kapaibacteriota bacterium]|jgi:dUTP pyrophosphatase
MQTVAITRTKQGFDDIPLPHYASKGAAGADIRAALDAPIIIPSGSIAMIPTSFAVQIPDGYEIQVRSRSGLAAKHGIFCLNAPGTIDSDFRGEIHVILANFGKNDFTIERGERIAQLVLARYEQIDWRESEDLEETERGSGGFGSTGKH